MNLEKNKIIERARCIAESGGLLSALENKKISPKISCSLSEGIVLGLLKQNVCKYLVIFGHGSTDLGEVLRIYDEAGVTSTFNFRNEIAMAHAATTLRWQYDERAALITSIGPGAMQAFAGSLTSASNGVGVYHIYGDETTYGEGYNMQQVPKPEQELFGRLTALMGQSYVLHTPSALKAALKRGSLRINHPYKSGPFYILLPINTQPIRIDSLNLDALPVCQQIPKTTVADEIHINETIDLIQNSEKIIIKAGGGSRKFSEVLKLFAELCDIPVVLSPGSTGVLPDKHSLNMHVGGSKGSISGNFAMANADLLIVIGSRAVCQSDCSGTGYEKVQNVININGDLDDITHYNKSILLPGDIGIILKKLIKKIESKKLNKIKNKNAWIIACLKKKNEWNDFKQNRISPLTLYDEIWDDNILTQPAAIKIVADFANTIKAVKYFDAGDVQANGFQIIEDDNPFQTLTDSGASYMGFAPSSLNANAISDNNIYAICFCGDGSFIMNPQILVDAVEHKVNGMLVIFDNRRMGAISALQNAQYGNDFKTNDSVKVDYVKMAKSVAGVNAYFGGKSKEELVNVLNKAKTYNGLSVIHIPVYFGNDPRGGMGAYGAWNVGSWCENVQENYLNQHL